MTDAATALPPAALPLPAGLAGAGGLRPLDGPSRPQATSGDAGDGAPGDPFALVLLGFLGATLPPTPPAPVAPAADAPPAPGAAPAQAVPLPGTPADPGAAPAATPAAAPAGTGNGLPLAGAGLPIAPDPDAAAAPAEPGADSDGPTASGLPSPVAAGLPRGSGSGAEAVRPAPVEGARDAAALLADLAWSRTALAAAPRRTAAPGTPGPTGDRPLADPAPATADATTAGATREAPVPTTLGAGPAPGIASPAAPLAPAGSGGASARGPATGGPPPGTLAPLADGPGFASGLGERLLDLGRDGVQSARLRLHPESLGPLDVRIRIDDGEARVWFNAAHVQARDAIEASLPRLRELFAAQGIDLGRVQVELRSDGGSGQGVPTGTGEAFAGDPRQPRHNPHADEPAPARRAPVWAAGLALPAALTGSGRERLLDVLA